MLKNTRFATKIGGGFAALLVLLGFVAVMGITGLTQVNQRVEGMTAAKDISIAILEARREEKNFIIRGGDEYVAKVAKAVGTLDAATARLAASGLGAAQAAAVKDIATASREYAAAFASYVSASAEVNAAVAQWDALGDKAGAALSAQADSRTGSSFMRMQTAAAYYLKDRTDERAAAFAAATEAFASSLSRQAPGAGVMAEMAADGAKITGQLRGLFQQQAQLDTALVSTGRAVIENAGKVEKGLEADMLRTEVFSRMLILLSAAGALLLGILLAIFLTRGITIPVRKAVSFAGLLSDCDFSGTLDISQKDEMGHLAASLNDIAVRMRAMCGSIQDSAEQVSASSEQIAASAQVLANGSQSQASALEETSAAMEELAASVEQVAGHAQAQAASGEQGSTAMSQVRTAVDDISRTLGGIATLAAQSVEKSVEGAQAVQKVVEAINRISTGSEKIAGIVTVISEIADQTNLLALNASIEAARAGEHGRGFAVVAQEVSKLADRSASSTKEIDSLIKESVQSVSQGVQIAQSSHAAMDQIRDASQQVKTMIEELSVSLGQQIEALKELVGAIESISEMSQNISAATGEQTTNAREVSKAVENVSELTQNTASAAEQMSASTEQLSGMAVQLRSLIAGFKTGLTRADLPAGAAGTPALVSEMVSDA
jgi:methyl-accepting chemotaxis protein